MIATDDTDLLFDPEEDGKGAFGAPLRFPEGVSFTRTERAALKHVFGSVTKGVRKLIGRRKFERVVMLYRAQTNSSRN